MKILLLNPPKVDGLCVMREEMTYGKSTQNINPFDLAILSAIFKEHGFETKLYDSQGLNHGVDDVTSEIKDYNPDFIITQTTFASYQEDTILFKKIKESSNAKIICSFVPKLTKTLSRLFIDLSEVDYLVLNEPYYTPFAFIAMGDKRGLAYKKVDKLMYSLKKEFIDVNELPVADYQSLPMESYDVVYINSMRDCPFRCTFCTHASADMMKMRGWYTAERLFAEFDSIHKNGGKRVDLGDSNPFIDKKRLEDFCKKIIEKNLQMIWECNGRVGTTDSDLVELMKKAGCYSIVLGVESGSDKMLKAMNKDITVKESIEGVNVLRELNMPVSYHLIIGLPGETKETLNETMEFIETTKPDNLSVNIATPFPHTKFFDYCIEKRLCKEEDFLTKKFDHRSMQFIESELNLNDEKKRMIKSVKFRPWYIKNKIKRWIKGEYPHGISHMIKAGADILRNR